MKLIDAKERVEDSVQIVGAGPAGLAAAITLARAGRHAIVHETHPQIGYRFGSDLQGLENWSTEQDGLEWLKCLGLTTDFAALPCVRGIGFDAWGERYDIVGNKPIFYLVERGPGPETLDTALLSQARALGVEVRFNSRLSQVEGPAVLATGPKTADAIAVGYHFESDLDDGFWIIYDDDIAPKGYAYLLVMNGHGTVKSCMFTGFKHEKQYVERTVEAFQRLVGLQMKNPQPHGGVGNLRIPKRAITGGHPVVGEQAGFQDILWGFGLRFAMLSGVLAARSLLEGVDYDALWQRELGPQLWNGQVNRAIFTVLGNRGYRWVLRRSQTNRWDAQKILRTLYRPLQVKRLLLPWARHQQRTRRKDTSCNHADCACVWCRHGRHTVAEAFCNTEHSHGGIDE